MYNEFVGYESNEEFDAYTHYAVIERMCMLDRPRVSSLSEEPYYVDGMLGYQLRNGRIKAKFAKVGE